jgi:Rho GDP-dissociation inhibitor
MSTPGSPDTTFSLPLPSSQEPTFVLKEGSSYSLQFSFSVQKNLVPGLTYVNKVWKSGMLGEFFIHFVP